VKTLIQPRRQSTGMHSSSGAPVNRHGLYIAGIIFIGLLWFSSSQTISVAHLACASFLLFMGIHAYLSWVEKKETKIPVWPLLCLIHFVYFGLPIFGASRESPSSYDQGASFSDSALATAMLLGLVGLISIGLGRNAGLRFARSSTIQPSLIDIRKHTPSRVQILLILGITANLFGIALLYETVLWNASVIVFTTLPMAAFLWVALAASHRRIGQVDLLLAIAFFVTRLIYGARFGASLGTIVGPFLLLGLAAVSVNRSLPWRMIGIVACVVLFLQPSKGVLREEMKTGNLESSPGASLVRWVDVATLLSG
jgi:hypothetical protein